MRKKSSLLTKRKLNSFLKKFAEWKLDAAGKKVSRTFTSDDHVAALVFVARVTVHASVLNHFPAIHLTTRKVRLMVTTKELKGLTAIDLALIERIEKLHTSG